MGPLDLISACEGIPIKRESRTFLKETCVQACLAKVTLRVAKKGLGDGVWRKVFSQTTKELELCS
jgi:hypothetical protein